jgi:hypothetical protein
MQYLLHVTLCYRNIVALYRMLAVNSAMRGQLRRRHLSRRPTAGRCLFPARPFLFPGARDART